MSSDRSREAGYLPFVDGLRAIAIIAVVGYHVGWPGFSGGFVGVDVFFVISGFLIIGHITGQVERGRFSFTDFYARRVLRLMPLLLSVLLVICAIAPFILVTPDEYKDFGGSAAAAAVMLSNHFFLANQGYFDRAADTKVLLHTWSLGVEAQFYVVAPMLVVALAALAGKARRTAFWIVGGLVAALSFAGCVAFTDVGGHNDAFFLMVFRAWEFAAGAAVPALARRLQSMSRRWTDCAGLGGLLMIVVCTVLYSAQFAYPSWWPLLPVLGATLVIAAGEASDRTPVKRLLSLAPIAGIGLVSYGWYLWHWPLITFNRIYHFDSHDLLSDTLLGGPVALGLAVLTYMAVERPVARNRRLLLSWHRLMPIGAGIGLCMVAAIPGVLYERSVAHRIEKQLGATAWPDKTSLKRVKDACVMQRDMQLPAQCLAAAPVRLGILVGDSHAREAYPTLAAKASAQGARFVTMVNAGCPPLFETDILMLGQRQGCERKWQAGVASLAARHLPLAYAIVESAWTNYVGGDGNGRPTRMLADPSGGHAAADQYATLMDGLKSTIATLRSLGVQRILIVGPEPRFKRDAPACLLRARQRGLGPDTCTRPEVELQAEHGDMLAALQSAAKGDGDIRLIDPYAALCDGQICSQQRNGAPLYLDDNHLSRVGYRLLYGYFASDLTWVSGRTTAAAAPGTAVR